jgi:AcrR family transcriptional regulator
MARSTSPPAGRRGADPEGTPSSRRDVLRNRNALLDAARELFSSGAPVPMYEIGRRAGVGQATLYRHFPDRASLAAAIAEELIEDLEAAAADIGRGPDSFVALLRQVVAIVAHSRGLIAVVQDATGESQLAQLADRLLALLALPLEDAHAAGTVTDTFVAADSLLVLKMIQGTLEGNSDPGSRLAVANHALGFILEGICVPPPGPPDEGRRVRRAVSSPKSRR